jgi:hypothetical protein
VGRRRDADHVDGVRIGVVGQQARRQVGRRRVLVDRGRVVDRVDLVVDPVIVTVTLAVSLDRLPSDTAC